MGTALIAAQPLCTSLSTPCFLVCSGVQGSDKGRLRMLCCRNRYRTFLCSLPRRHLAQVPVCRASAGTLMTSSARPPPLLRISDSHAHVTPPPPPTASPSSAPGWSPAAADAASTAKPATLLRSCCGRSMTESESASDAAGQLEMRRTAQDAFSVSLSRVVICGTHPVLDWDAVAALADECTAGSSGTDGTQVIIGFGVHPWYAPELPGPGDATGTPGGQEDKAEEGKREGVDFNAFTAESLLAQLEERLQQFPRAIVAEIGLDKLRGPSQQAQEDLFLAQVKLAAKYRRPVSLHCVRHYGLLLELLDKRLVFREDVPPAIVVHGFSGSCSVAQSLMKMKHKKLSRSPPEHAGEDGGGDSQAKPRPARGARDAVKISERVFFGVGQSTSLTVKDFGSATLPLLLRSRRALAETDRFYRAEGSPRRQGGLCLSASTADDADDTAAEEREAVSRQLAPVLALVSEGHATATDGSTRESGQAGAADRDGARVIEAAAVSALLEETFATAFATVLS